MDNPIKDILAKLDGHISLGLQYYLRHHLETWFERDQKSRDWYTNVEVLNEARRLAPYFGGVLQQYVELREEDDYSEVPTNLTNLVKCLSYRQEPSEMLIRYAASPSLWVGMKFDQPETNLLTACRRGAVGYIKWFMTWNELKVEPAHIKEAILHGQLEVLKFFDQLELIDLTNLEINISSITNLSIEILDWLREHGLEIWAWKLYPPFLCQGRIDLVEWLDEKYGPMKYGIIVSLFIERAPIASLNWVEQNYPNLINLKDIGYKDNENTLVFANPEHIAWYAERAKFSPNKLFRLACFRGNLPIAKWLHANYNLYKISKHNFRLFRQVCGKGRLEIAKWMVETWPNIDPLAERCDALIQAYKHKNSPQDDGRYTRLSKWFCQKWPNVRTKAERLHNIYICA